ncbi:gp53-like domain-containing protein [Fusobacterium mortiferum]|uniref:gp53-like domain-containing protein n=1 Tax=Fusobacterium mortiferum TaxID=850 RepID=UPI001F24B052|nr:hypothetical protein [Fusobacterium mortiferum]MCF2698043.1 hypothetical protein [Fusobacterium mortiferum]
MVQKEKKYITWEGLNQHAKNVGKKIKEYDAGVIGGYNGSFPLTAATKGNIYLLPATKKYYVCIENYNGSQLTAPNANFEELSVYTNRSKLDNLIKINEQYGSVIIKCGSLYLKNGAKFTFDSPFKNRCLGVFVTDISTSNTTIYHHAVENVNVSGFDFFTTYNLGNDTAYYLAIGY